VSGTVVLTVASCCASQIWPTLLAVVSDAFEVRVM
jgi:hypothetical protein